MKKLLLIWIVLNVFEIKAQSTFNLLIDSSFEKYNFLPESQYINKINTMLPFWYQPTTGTPDFFHTQSNHFMFTLPYSKYFYSLNNCINYQMPKSGNGVGGLIVSNVYDTIRKHKNYYEYLQTKLAQPLNKNHHYFVRFYANRDHCSSMAVSNLGAYLSQDSIRNYNGIDSLNFTDFKEKIVPQIYNKDFVVIEDTVNWTSVSGVLKAKGGERWLTIGRFNDLVYNEIIYDTFNQFGVYFSSSSYYYIDDVSVTEIPSVIYDDTLCSGQMAIVTSTFKGPFSWFQNNILMSTDSVFSFIAKQNTELILHSFNRKDTIQIVVKKDAYFSLGQDTFVCQGSTFQLIVPIEKAKFRWQDGSLDSVFEISQGGKYILQVSKNNCSFSDTINIEQRNKPLLNYTSTEVCNSDLVYALIQLDSSYQYFWQPLKDTSHHRKIYQKGCQSLMVYGNNQCELDTQICITALCEPILWIPNAFTPNGFNPIFQCKGINIGRFNLTIYNSWGEKIKEINQIDDFWDGSYKGNNCESGVYMYQLQYSGIGINQKFLSEKGIIHLLR